MSQTRRSALLTVGAALLAALIVGAIPAQTAVAREDPGVIPDAQLYVAPSDPTPDTVESLARGGYEVVVIPSLRMPVATSPITSRFGHRVCHYGPCPTFHKGVDYVPGSGAEVRSLAAGTVSYTGYDGDYGNKIIVEHEVHGERFSTLYAHLAHGSIAVSQGQPVEVGTFIGRVGNTGLSYGAHLHFEIRVDGIPVDPETWLAGHDVAAFPG